MACRRLLNPGPCGDEMQSICRTPLVASVVSNFVNFGLDLFLMFVLGWGVAGAGMLVW